VWYVAAPVKRGAGSCGRLLAVLAAGALAASLAPAVGAGATSPLRARQDDLRARDAALARREHAAALELYALESAVARARAARAQLDARAAAAARARAEAARRAAVVARSRSVARARLARTLRLLYKQGQPSPIAILLGASSLDEAAAGIDGLVRAARENRRLIERLHAAERRLARARAVLARRELVLATARARAAAAVARLETLLAARAAELRSLETRRRLTAREAARLFALARAARRRSALLTERARATRERGRATVAPAAGRAPSPGSADPPAAPPEAPPAPAPPAAAPPPPRPGPAGAAGTRTLVVDAVAYHLPGRTASGLPVGVGVVAVDPAVIPLGTRLYVPGYGPAVAADVGSAVRGYVIDLWMPSRAQARGWGRRTVTITVYG